MTAPITPDERAAMRETVAALDAAWEVDDPTRPLVTEHATLTLLAHVASAVPRLLDALDTAEAEVARLRAVVREHLPVSGESRATVQAEALRDAADAMDADVEVHDPLRLRADWLRARADRIEKGETR